MGKKDTSTPILHTIHKNELRIRDFCEKKGSRGVAEESTGQFLYNAGVGKGFLPMTHSPDEIKEKMGKFDYIRSMFFNCLVKNSYFATGMKTGENIFARSFLGR